MRKPSRRLLLQVALILATALAPHGAATAQDNALEMCLARAADMSPVYPTRVFPAGTREIYATFQLPKGASYKQLQATATAVDVERAPSPNLQIGTATLALKGHARGSFNLEFPKPMPAGKYRFDVAADGKPWKSVDFEVAAREMQAPKSRNTEELIPLRDGQGWTYSFVQEAGEGARINLPDVKPGADGKYRATVTMKVAGTDANGTHVEMRRNDRLVFEEWWRLDKDGLAATQRKTGAETVTLTPPQVLWKLPLKTPVKWSYLPKDKSYRQIYTMWGPLPVKTQAGDAPGYVVLVEQGNTTVERHFVPGVGLVREIIVVALGGDLLSRQEMVLQK
jgi:hypothetical protein